MMPDSYRCSRGWSTAATWNGANRKVKLQTKIIENNKSKINIEQLEQTINKKI